MELSASSADVSLEKSVNEEEKLPAKRALKNQQKKANQDGVADMTASILSGSTMKTGENKSETVNIEENTENCVTTRDSRTLMFKSSEDIRSAHSQDEHFESYFESLARRKSYSLERPTNQSTNTRRLQKED